MECGYGNDPNAANFAECYISNCLAGQPAQDFFNGRQVIINTRQCAVDCGQKYLTSSSS